MADTISLAAETRPGNGKGEARDLRNEGRVPVVAYGKDLDPVPLHVDEKELRHALSTDAGENAIISLEYDGGSQLAMAREIHRHPLKRTVLHLDFVAIDTKTAVVVDVPVNVVGRVADSVVVNQPMNVLSVEVLPLDVPEFIEVSIDGFEVGDLIRVSDVETPEGVVLLDDPDRTVVSVNAPDAVETPEASSDEEGEEGEAGETAAEEADADGE